MELSGKKRLLLGITIIGIVVLCFVSGFLLGRVRPSGRTSFVYSDELTEVVDYLDKYYYKEYDKEAFEKAYIKGGVTSLNDPYTYVYYVENTNNSASYYGYGLGVSNSSLGYKVSSVTKNSPADKAGIKKGDYIVGIDDLKMGKNTISEIDAYMVSKDEEVTMYLLRNYREFSVKIKKGTVNTDALIESKLIGSIGYIKINQFDTGAAEEFKKQLLDLESKHITGLIIDVRDNPGGLASEVAPILRLFLTGDDAFLYLEGKNENPDIYRPATDTVKKSYDIKVLINENSASASEVFALAMNRVMNYDLVGTKTFGKGVFQSDIKLTTNPNAYLHVTRGYWYGYNKENIHAKGIEATVEIDSSYFTPFPVSESTFELDMANDYIKDVEIMLDTLGYTTRVDGYFDSNLKDILVANYSSEVLDNATSKKIYDDYNNYIKDINNDKAVNKALSLFE